MRFVSFVAPVLVGLACCNCLSAQNISISQPKFTLHCAPEDSSALLARLVASTQSVEQFFGHSFPRKFDVYIFPNRAALDKQWQQD